MEHVKLINEVCMRQGWQHDGPDVSIAFGDGRHQLVQSELYLFEGEEMIRLYTRVGSLSRLSDTQRSALLGLNFSLAFGALASIGDDLVMTETMLMRDTVHDQLAYAIRFLADTADGYEKEIFGTDQY